MDLINELLLSNAKKENALIEANVDPEKHEKIVRTLCEKRRAFEIALKNEESTTKETDALAFMELKESMRTFGISEVQYQTYLAQVESQQEKNITQAAPAPAPAPAPAGGENENIFRD